MVQDVAPSADIYGLGTLLPADWPTTVLTLGATGNLQGGSAR